MKWEIVLPKIQIRDFNPVTASRKKVERKKDLRKRLEDEIGSNLPKIRKKTFGHPLFVDVCFYLLESKKLGKSGKDLDNLLKILFDVLSDNMINGQNPIKGLGLMKDDTFIYKIKCDKKINSRSRRGIDLKISKGI